MVLLDLNGSDIGVPQAPKTNNLPNLNYCLNTKLISDLKMSLNRALLYHHTGTPDFFGLLFSNPMFPLFLQIPENKVLDPNGPYMSVSNFGILCVVCRRLSVARLQPTLAYVEA